VCRLAEQFLVLVPGSELRFYQKKHLRCSWFLALATCDKCARFGLEVYDFAKETDQ
jgi:hypothetical protein